MKRWIGILAVIFAGLAPGGVAADAAVPHLSWEWLQENYAKREVYVPMRDGVRLHMAVYEPADSLPHPVILLRTPYGVGPYGEKFAGSLRSWMRMFSLNRYIIVFQSVRGTYLSEGEYENIRPLKPVDAPWAQTDEATDAYDTVEWILVQFRQGFHCRCVERCHGQLLEASFKEGRAGLFGGYL